MGDRSLRVILVAGGLLMVACGARSERGDSSSQELLRITHQQPPRGSLALHEDDTYSFLNPDTRTEDHGRLSSEQQRELHTRLTPPVLDNVLHAPEPDESCTNGPGYFVTTSEGTACFVLAEERDGDTRSALAYVITLFETKAQSAD